MQQSFRRAFVLGDRLVVARELALTIGLVLAAAPVLVAGEPVTALGSTASTDSFVAISPCRVTEPWAQEPLADLQSRVLAFTADSCGVPDGATAVLVEVTAVAPSAAVRLAVLPGSRNAVAPISIAAQPGQDRRGTVTVPLDADRSGLLGVQAHFAGAGGSVSVAADIVGYLEAAVTFSGTTGFITTRPACVPPRYTPDRLNYLQGPEPIQMPNGDLTLLVGAGKCCTGHWEGIFSLNYPAAGRLATPRFQGLWATNDFGTRKNRKEAEVGFPSALRHNGKWRIALASTFLPFHRPNRDRVGRLDLPDLVSRAALAQVINSWVLPIDPKCKQITSCSGSGSGLDPVLTRHPNGDLFVYHKDGNYPACSSGYVRHRVAADLAVASAKPDGCVRFEGLTAAPFFISDIARTRDGRMLLLVEKMEGRGAIQEWESTGAAAEIGLHWRPTGRLWPAPAHPRGAPWVYYVRDAAFLKDDARTVVEPNLVVAQISDGTTYAELVNVQLGRWYLYYWAEDEAQLPPSFGGPASSCALQGAVESASCTEVRGWVWDPTFPAAPIGVDIVVDGAVLATVPADVFRSDLVAAGRGDGRHGFSWPLPAALRDGRKHRLSVRFGDSADVLPGKTSVLRCR